MKLVTCRVTLSRQTSYKAEGFPTLILNSLSEAFLRLYTIAVEKVKQQNKESQVTTQRGFTLMISRSFVTNLKFLLVTSALTP